MATAWDLVYFWESAGVFDLLLPFLLIFAIVYGILASMKIFGDNRAVHVVIALALGLLAVRTGMVQQFIVEVFPRLGVGLFALLAVLILVGLFVAENERRFWLWGLGVVGVVIAATVLWKSFENLGWTWLNSIGYGGDTMIWTIITLGGLIGIIIAIINSNKPSRPISGSAKSAPLFGG